LLDLRGFVKTLGTGNVEDDGGLSVVVGGTEFAVDDGESAEELAAGEGEDGGFAGGDAVPCEEEKNAGEEVVDGNGRAELGEIVGESGGDFGRIGFIDGKLGVNGAEGGIEIGDGESATLVVRVAMLATGVAGAAGFSG
jgi:hypothetical protein